MSDKRFTPDEKLEKLGTEHVADAQNMLKISTRKAETSLHLIGEFGNGKLLSVMRF